MLSKQQIIEETVEYYKNNPFGYDPKKFGCSGGCVYYGTEGQMCAVGRCLIDAAFVLNQSDSVTKLLNTFGEDILQEKYRGHDADFWQNLQFFHDDCATGCFKLEDYKQYPNLIQYYA